MRPTCVCCNSMPQAQLGQLLVFPSNREVLEKVKEWRTLWPTRALKDAMCFPNDIVSMGGKQCRKEEGHICQGQNNNQCLIYYITAPYYHTNIPFLINNQKIKIKVEKLVEEERKLWKNRTRNSATEIAKRVAFEAFLDKTFLVTREDIRDLIKSCPVR